MINGFDNPILSTDTVTDPSGPRPYPANPPVVNVSGADVLTAGALNVSTQTVLRDWSLAKAWLRREMAQAGYE